MSGAIEGFQRSKGLRVDGIVAAGGPTDRALYDALRWKGRWTPLGDLAAIYRPIQPRNALGDVAAAHSRIGPRNVLGELAAFAGPPAHGVILRGPSEPGRRHAYPTLLGDISDEVRGMGSMYDAVEAESQLERPQILEGTPGSGKASESGLPRYAQLYPLHKYMGSG